MIDICYRPPGVFEFEKFAHGTKAVMDAIVSATKAGACTIIGEYIATKAGACAIIKYRQEYGTDQVR